MIVCNKIIKRLLLGCAALLGACSDSIQFPSSIGYVEADWIYVSASQSGQITSRPVSAGDVVSIDDVLFELDKENQLAALAEAEGRIVQLKAEELNLSTGARPAEIRALEARLEEARARLVQSESERERILPLVDRGAESTNRGEKVQANYDIATASVKAIEEEIVVAKLAARQGIREAANAGITTAEAARSAAEIQLRERTIAAPVAGRIEQAFHREGEFVMAGAPVFALLPEDGLKIKFFVAQTDLPQLQMGKTINVRADGMSEVVNARVSFIASEAEYTPPVIYSNQAREKLVFLIEADVSADSGLHPGLPVNVEWSSS